MSKKCFVIGVSGGSGSGKTYFVKKFREQYYTKSISILNQDNYYKDLSHLSFAEREKINFDDPDSLDFDLMASHLQELNNGNCVEIPVYNFAEHTRTNLTEKICPTEIILVDGILILNSDAVRNQLDLKIFMETDSDLRIVRRIERDMRERGRTVDSVISQYLNTVRPMYKKYIEPSRNKADLVLSGEIDVKKNLELVRKKLN